jgi:ssDNA-binding Zn-finger/Zn-ribbon topoisomerase 1
MLVEIRNAMKYGLVNGEKTSASSKLVGFCPLCGGQLVSKCGNTKVHHWAHKNTKECDSWWERETQWHRDWKNCFPVEWQEVVHKDQSGEKHIADIKTPDGLVVEFQHSHITREERDSRETFYEHMIWVVDGTRRKMDYRKFDSGRKSLTRTPMANVYFVLYPEKILPNDWLDSKEIVILDFNGISNHEHPSKQQLAMFWLPKGESLMRCKQIPKFDVISLVASGALWRLLNE